MGNTNLSFTGEYEYSLDQKNRLIIPVRFRKALSDTNNKTFVLTKGLDDCLVLYPLNEWHNVERQLGHLSTIKEKNRNFIRNVVRYATYLKYDGQGRIAIPSPLLSHSKIKKEVILIGMIKKIEIWNIDILNKISYDNYTNSKDFEDLANEIDFWQKMNIVPHVPIMTDEMCEHLLNKKDGIYLDGTVGFGGHSSKILEYINKNGYLIGLDLDPYALEYSNKHLSVHLNSFSLYHANYKEFPKIINSLGIRKLNGMLFDLGTSSYQIDSEHRGFAYMKESNLDMRFNFHNGFTAQEFLNSTDEKTLTDIIYFNSGEKKSKKIANSILKYVKQGKMITTLDLRKSIECVIGQKYLIKSLSRVFQSIRVHINDELHSLKELLSIALDYLDHDGKIIFITFHSIEDRMIKSFLKNNSIKCICPKEIPVCQCDISPKIEIITKKPITPSRVEILRNNRSRSAKMRVARSL